MAKNSYVEITEATNAFWEGCSKVSDGCLHCYAERQLGVEKFAVVRRTSDKTFYAPLKWTDANRWVFANSRADFFDKRGDEWRDDAWSVIDQTPWLFWVIITKRPQNIASRLPAMWGSGWYNVMLMVTAENQTEATRRVPLLMETPALWRGVICEPMLGPVDLRPWLPDLDWIIAGGESGPEARRIRGEWALSLRDQCVAAGKPFFFKQWGSLNPKNWHDRYSGDQATIQGEHWQQRPLVDELEPAPDTVRPAQSRLL